MKYNSYIIIFFILIILYLLYTTLLPRFYSSPVDDNMIFIYDFLSPQDFQRVQQTIANDTSPFINESFRITKPLNHIYHSDIYDILYSSQSIQKLQDYTNPTIFASEFPIEYREYPLHSPGMRWHKDILLYEKPQYEAVFTIENTSDSYTQWVDPEGNLYYVWTPPNSLLVMKASGYLHNVTPINQGKRNILKLVYTQTDDKLPVYEKQMERFNSHKQAPPSPT